MADFITVAIFPTSVENSHFFVSKQTATSTNVTRRVGKNNVFHSREKSDCHFVWLQQKMTIFLIRGENSHFPVSKQTVTCTNVTRCVGKNNVFYSWKKSDCQFVWLHHLPSTRNANFSLIDNRSFSPLVKAKAIFQLNILLSPFVLRRENGWFHNCCYFPHSWWK